MTEIAYLIEGSILLYLNKNENFWKRLRIKPCRVMIFLAGCLVLSGCSDINIRQETAVDDGCFVQNYNNEQDQTISTDEVLQNVCKVIPEQCVISGEELDFYKSLYKKEHTDLDGNEVSADVFLAFIAQYYAEFYLANYYGICQDVSFEAIKQQWEAENVSRQQKKQDGEVFYGPVEYKFEDYFSYLYSNMKLQNIESLVAHADENLLEAGRLYYEQNSTSYDDLVGAVCRLSDGEREEEKVFSYDDIQSLYKTNEAVLNFIMNSDVGAVMQYQNGDKTVTVELISKEIDHKEFDDMRGVIMNDYVQREFYDTFVKEISASIHIVLEDS